RPLNAFMLYRRDKQHAVPSKNHQSISRIIGQLWRNETAATKKFYTDLAKRAKEEHEQMYPGYKFAPKKK
ncbi:high mobility group box, partial [Saitoella complicata NRRL Y-17804]